jgi:hypothetical protein
METMQVFDKIIHIIHLQLSQYNGKYKIMRFEPYRIIGPDISKKRSLLFNETIPLEERLQTILEIADIFIEQVNYSRIKINNVYYNGYDFYEQEKTKYVELTDIHERFQQLFVLLYISHKIGITGGNTIYKIDDSYRESNEDIKSILSENNWEEPFV